MFKKLLIIGAVVAMAAVSQAQTNDAIKQHVITFYQNVASNRTVSVALYPSYAPQIVIDGKKDSFGFGLAVLCPASAISSLADSSIAQHSFAGLRFDYIGHQAFASTVALGMRGNFQLWGHDFLLFAQSGVNIPFSGFGIHNGDIGAMAGGGIYTSLISFDSGKGSLGLQVSAEKWTQFQGEIFHGGPVVNWSF